jgi:hypothetical protein
MGYRNDIETLSSKYRSEKSIPHIPQNLLVHSLYATWMMRVERDVVCDTKPPDQRFVLIRVEPPDSVVDVRYTEPKAEF